MPEDNLAPPDHPDPQGEAVKAKYLLDMNTGIYHQVRNLKAHLLLATSAGDLFPGTMEYLYQEFLAMAGMVEKR